MSIELRNIAGGYREGQEIIHGVSISAKESEITCIIGPNGAGKSTILKMVCGFLKPNRGRILLNGEDITGIEPHALPFKRVSYIPQERSIFPLLSVQKNLEMGAWSLRRDKRLVKERIEEIYERFPILEERKKVMALNLSGGMQRMLELGMALITHPQTILLDEPTSGLAPKIAEGIYQELKKLKSEGKTLLMVDQNVKKAITLSDFGYILKMGKVTKEGARKEFYNEMYGLIKEWLV